MGIDFGVLNTQLSEERQAIEKQVKALEEKVRGPGPALPGSAGRCWGSCRKSTP